jgi:peptidoglycan/xylan/chitin deacetylase (PgdA/CDA1 family)
VKRRAFLAAALLASPAAARDIAITFDDLPSHSALPPGTTRLQIAQDVIAALKAAGVPSVYGFVNGYQLAAEPESQAVLSIWRKAGFPLGNHGWAHQGLSKVDEATFEGDIVKTERLVKPLMAGKDWRWYRFPFLDEAAGDPAKRATSRAYLAAHGYRIAAVTASFADYAFNEPYARCVAKGDKAAIADLENSYLAAADTSIRLSEAEEQVQFGHTPPDILLMHLGAFDAHMMPRLLALYRQHGFRFVPLAMAAKDPANIGLVDPGLPSLPGRTLGTAESDAIVQRIGTLCR